MDVVIPLYDRFTMLDAVGPYQVLAAVPGTRIHWLAEQAGPVKDESGTAALVADGAWEDVPRPDVVVVPGGFGTRALLRDERALSWLRGVHEHTRFTTSVCTGSLWLAAAGILDGLEATGHWAAMDQLAELGARPTGRRVVEQGKVITAAGVSSGIDMALTLVARLVAPEAAQAVQLAIEYDPQPPFDAGSPEKAPPEIVALVRSVMDAQG
ncbi:DJ-1/PfpI family protein [Conexibacter sp. W3-3-2]|uniref:Glutamine amidotransferase n=1 Tax=Paraconexibacter algicola TaxID=2133960 RepID=A0A2T4UJY2_9ACTN|nr:MULTISPECIES: DJ-1/PfpI family protein [Solirubrobacterales]MTD45845.1 DJ-1/PfpI family protein [Conexibacter sp. W3-3-2]PTL59498.1 glutamine amidotransferase [Paraconexibacter algicola]